MTPAFIQFCETRFQTEFSLLNPQMPILYSNVPVPDTVDAFVCLHVMASEDTMPINIGHEAKSRNVGLIQVDVFTPKDEGAGEAYNMAYQAGMIFKRQDLSVGGEGLVVFKDPSIQDRGQVRGRHKHQMRVPYRYDFKDFFLP
jgi:hypothetical protein